MTDGTQRLVFSPAKMMVAEDRIRSYLRGERVYPITMEMDLTQSCTRSCPACPYGAAREQNLTLAMPFLERLFGILGPNTPGLVLSGGEPTSVPHFPEAIALARKTGFKEIAVITNGSCLHDPRIQDALFEGVTSVRVSLYDWQEGDSDHFLTTLRNIARLRELADARSSPLEISAAMLTRREWAHRFEAVTQAAFESGIHWLYFHPFCVDWDNHHPEQADQTGVLDVIAELTQNSPRAADIHVPYERYSRDPLVFSRLHGSCFLIQVGADGVNYAGPECKYDPDYALLDLTSYLETDFLWHPQRLAGIAAINSDNYSPIGTRHRPPIFSAYLQDVADRTPEIGTQAQPSEISFHQPHII